MDIHRKLKRHRQAIAVWALCFIICTALVIIVSVTVTNRMHPIATFISNFAIASAFWFLIAAIVRRAVTRMFSEGGR